MESRSEGSGVSQESDEGVEVEDNEESDAGEELEYFVDSDELSESGTFLPGELSPLNFKSFKTRWSCFILTKSTQTIRPEKITGVNLFHRKLLFKKFSKTAIEK